MKDLTKRTANIIIGLLWFMFGAVMLLIFFVFFGIAKDWRGDMPSVTDLENPIDKFASQVITSDGVVLGSYSYAGDNRVWVDFDELSPYLVQALIATEDIRFQDHSGIDFRALVRAIVKRLILQQKSAGGGSTITQQLAKLLYTEQVARSSVQRILQKPSEWVIAVRLEKY